MSSENVLRDSLGPSVPMPAIDDMPAAIALQRTVQVLMGDVLSSCYRCPTTRYDCQNLLPTTAFLALERPVDIMGSTQTTRRALSRAR